MAKVIDFTDGGDRDVLTQTESDGLFGGVFLADRPLASYLHSEEEPKYLLQNKKSGLQIEGEEAGSRTIEPDGDYRALALATDQRLLVVVGGEAGDQSHSLSLSDIVEADVESGLRSSTLVVETLSGERWEFPCRGDPEPVAGFLEDAAQAWANAGRLLDELADALDESETHLGDGAYQAAADLVSDADEKIRTARRRGAEVGTGAEAKIGERVASLRGQLRDVRRRIRAAAGASAHARAQEDWGDQSYESAASAYDSAIEAYETALEVEGSTPSDETLRARLDGATTERELLRVAPLVDADAARRRATDLRDSEAAAEQWEQALEGYRELLGLDWGSEDREFVVNREQIREQTVETADDAIDDHLDAGVQWLEPGDELAVEGSDYEADELYKMARHQFEQAHQLATEVKPDRVDEIEAAIEAVETRLDEERPRERVPEDPITTEFDVESPDESEESDRAETDWEGSTIDKSADSSGDDGTTATADPGPPEIDEKAGEFADLSFPSAADEPTPPESSAPGGAVPNAGGPAGSSRTDGAAEDVRSREPEGSSVLDEIQSRKHGQEDTTPSGEPRTDGAEPVETGGGTDEQESATSEVSEQESATNEVDGRGPANPGGHPSQTDQYRPEGESLASVDVPREHLSERLRRLEGSALTDLVAALWEQEGWQTRAFDGGGDATYDLVATREEEDAERQMLIWTLQRRDGGEVGEALVRRCATTLENSPSADGGVLMTTGSLTRAAESLSVGFDLEVADCDELASRLASAKLPPEIAAMLAE
jgi:hypothetical protein